MLASPVLNAVARSLEAIEAFGPDPQVNEVARELRLAEAELQTLLQELETAVDDTARLRAMQRYNHSTRWATLLITTLGDLLKEPVY